MAIPIFSQIGNFIRNIRSGQTFVGAGFQKTTNIWGLGTAEVYPPYEQDLAINKGFNSNTAVYSIIKKDAKKFGSIERYLENKATDDRYEDNHPLMQLLNRPNPHQSQDAFLTTLRAIYKTCGEAFIWLNRGDVTQVVNEVGQLVDRSERDYLSMPVVEMYVIPSNHMVIIPDPEDPFDILGYQLRDSPQLKFRKEDIIHWKDINLEWEVLSRPHLRGMSPLKPGLKTLTADNSAVDSMVRMFQNDGAKGAIVNKTIGGKIGPEQKAAVKRVVDEKINNKEIKNAIAALEGDWDYLDFGLTAVDMETLKGREFIYKELCFLFGVPYELFDSQVTYANKSEAQKGWIINEIKPDSLQLDGELNRVLLKAFKLEGKARICSNFDDLPELQEDKSKLMEWLNKAPLTGNQRLEALEFEKSDDPSMEEITTSELMYPVDQAEPDIPIDDTIAMSNAANGRTNRANGNRTLPKN